MEGVESDGNGKAPYYFMYASILGLDSEKEIHLLRDGKTRSTTGSIVSSIYNLKDTEGRDGSYFIFPDLSVRMEGTYRLKVFSVSRKSTPLSKTFAEQGLKIRIRKEVRSRAVKTKFRETPNDPPPKKRLRAQNYEINYETKDTESENESINEPSTVDSKVYDEPKSAKGYFKDRPIDGHYPPYERPPYMDRPPLDRPYERPPPYMDLPRPPYGEPRPPYEVRPPYVDTKPPYGEVRPPYGEVRPPYADHSRPLDRDRPPYPYHDPRDRPPFSDPRERPPYPGSKSPYSDYKPPFDYRDRPPYPARYERPYYDPYSRPPYPYYYPPHDPYYSYYPPPPVSHTSGQLRSPSLFPPHHPGSGPQLPPPGSGPQLPPPGSGPQLPPPNGHAIETNNLPPIQYFNEYKSPTPSDKSNDKERRLPPISAYHPRYEPLRHYTEDEKSVETKIESTQQDHEPVKEPAEAAVKEEVDELEED
ncbi:hypothetical protein HDV04_000437 [Boothiomyces sp. JEL0838]|nr:hypothetical protein HDV04_000437 [Boothiomyces sp. JEL0838]